MNDNRKQVVYLAGPLSRRTIVPEDFFLVTKVVNTVNALPGEYFTLNAIKTGFLYGARMDIIIEPFTGDQDDLGALVPSQIMTKVRDRDRL